LAWTTWWLALPDAFRNKAFRLEGFIFWWCLCPTLSPFVVFCYLLRSPFGGDGYITSVDNMDHIKW
jgi:hypothetical protein